MSRLMVRISNLGKEYHIAAVKTKHETLAQTLSSAITGPFRRARKLLRGQATGAAELDESFWALRDISFDINQGEVVGIVGKNGAGKSTLLKVLSRITEPTEGRAEIHGRVSSLLEVGTGFHSELTGRENIFLNGAILGMSSQEIDRKLDEIIEFSEIGRFIDTPIKHYSSGMKLRLAFSVAAHLEPEVMIVDEVLAVGDAAFQKKCIGKMGEVAEHGRTILFVSHNMGAVTQLCTRAVWLEDGVLKEDGPAVDVVSKYLLAGTESHGSWINADADRVDTEVQVLRAAIETLDRDVVGTVDFEHEFSVCIEYQVRKPVRGMAIVFQLIDSMGHIVLESTDHDTTGLRNAVRQPGAYTSMCHIPGSILRPGHYFVTVKAFTNGVKMYDKHENVLSFDISFVGYHMHHTRLGVITPVFRWEVSANPDREGRVA